MPVEEKVGLAGLFTNLAETQAPPGTLLEAENVVLRRPGCIEPRDGLQLAGTLASGFAAYGFSWRSKDFILRNNGTHVFDWRDTAGATYRYTPPTEPASGTPIDPQPMRRDIFSRAEARANLYLPYEAGVLKMETDAGPWKTTGIPHAITLDPVWVPDAAYGTWLPTTEQVGYRALLTRKDANGVVLRSVPTGHVVITNTTGGAAGVRLRIVVSRGVEWDAVELYRSRNVPASVQVDDELQLVATLPLAAFTLFTGGGSDPFAKYLLDANDGVSQDTRGELIYTAPSRGGISDQNERPPAAALTALYRGSLFFANVRSPRRIKFSGTFSDAIISTATGLGVRQYTGDRTNGSADLINMSSTVGLEKGMRIGNAGVDAHIVSIVGTTVTMSTPALATTAGVAFTFHDSVKVAGQWVAVAQRAAHTSAHQVSLATDGIEEMLARTIKPAESGHTHTFVVESLSRASTAQTIQATHGSEYTPRLPNYDGTPLALEQDVWPGGYMWSKPDEPEHVRPIDYAFVGDQNRAVLGLVPTRDALYFLKEDGIFRVTGANGVWRVDPIDPTARCVLPGSVRALRGRGVFVGDRGVAMVSDDGGVEMVSSPVNDQVKLLIDQIVANWLSTGFYELPGMAGGNAACVFERESEYTLARGSTMAPLVYNDITGAWTTLAYYGHASESLSYRALFNFERSGNCVLSLGVSYFKTLLSTDAGADYLRYDRATAVTVNSYAGGIATLSAAVNALEDDVIKDSAGRYWRVTAVVNSSASVPVTLGGGSAAMATGAATLYRSLRCSVTATGFAQPLSAQKQRGPLSTTWTKLVGPVRVRYAYQSSQSTAWVEEDAPTTLVKAGAGNGFANHERGGSLVARVVPNASARSWLMRARVRWAQVHGYAQLEGIHEEVTPMQPGAPQQVVP